MSQKEVIRIRSPHPAGFSLTQIGALKAVTGVEEVVYRSGALAVLIIPRPGVDLADLRARLLEVL